MIKIPTNFLLNKLTLQVDNQTTSDNLKISVKLKIITIFGCQKHCVIKTKESFKVN